ncbi:MAG TPA: methylated-DNA--[protein]-cysteine S-methyltransferase [Vicinamibacterales bacterium]|nr:methylated-DNA--[protein]-cysteine S-methyltransferase [Vicinamibacterales bacterium]
MTTERLWQAVLARDRRADGMFVYAVQSTRVYCRPSCPSRRPRRDRVAFFPNGTMAAAQGFRACRRCHPDRPATPAADTPVRRACALVARTPERAWTSARLASACGASVASLQRAFQRSLGLAPRDYIAACRRQRFLDRLRNGRPVTDAIYESGYGSPSRVYGGVTALGMTPATYGRGGQGAVIDWTTTATPLGRVIVGSTAAGMCFVGIGADDEDLVGSLRREFPRATIAGRPSRRLAPFAGVVRRIASGDRPDATLPLDIRGTAFQWKVWRALTGIPAGRTQSYRDVAAAIGRPTAVRAVARACATNPAALVIPCHRVVGADESMGGYRWGIDRKARLLERERTVAPGMSRR